MGGDAAVGFIEAAFGAGATGKRALFLAATSSFSSTSFLSSAAELVFLSFTPFSSSGPFFLFLP